MKKSMLLVLLLSPILLFLQRRNINILLFISLSMNVSGQLTDYINNLNGKVKQVIKTESSYNDTITIVKDYDIDGFLKIECTYSGNNLKKYSMKSRNKFSYKLDSKKRVSEILIIDEVKDKLKKIIKYKHSYYTINTLWKENRKWKPFYNHISRFTANHKEYKTKVILEGGMFHEYYKWNKDKTHLLQMRFETNDDEWQEFIYNYTYNEKGLLISKNYEVKIDSLFDCQFSQDLLGDIDVEYIFISSESNSFNTIFKYDEYDNCIEEQKTDYDGSICTKTYQIQYDNQDNWIKKEEYINGILSEILIRKIIYFNQI